MGNNKLLEEGDTVFSERYRRLSTFKVTRITATQAVCQTTPTSATRFKREYTECDYLDLVGKHDVWDSRHFCIETPELWERLKHQTQKDKVVSIKVDDLSEKQIEEVFLVIKSWETGTRFVAQFSGEPVEMAPNFYRVRDDNGSECHFHADIETGADCTIKVYENE